MIVFYVIIIGFIGITLAIKTWLIIQAIICIAIISYIIKNSEGLDGIPPFIGWLIFSIGMLIGDVYYYTNFYHGGTKIFDVFAWFFKP